GIASVIYDPAYVSCDDNGQTINVTITVTDPSGNSSSCSTSLFVTTPALTPTWERGLCDDTLRLFTNLPPDTAAGYVFNWSGPNGFSSFDENPIIANSDTTYSGTYTLIVQSASGCTSIGQTDVLIQELVSPVITTSDGSICAGDEITLTSQLFSGQVSYQWFQALPSGDVLLGQTSDPQFTFTPAPEGFDSYYAVVVSDTCSSAPGATIQVFVASVPLAEIAPLSTIICVTDSLFLAPSLIVDSLQYEWHGPSGYTSNDATPPGIPATDIDSPAWYYLIVSSPLCTSKPDSIQVSVQPSPATPSITGDAQACEGGTITLNASAGGENYIWINPD
ncbi:MAG TPA: hypothetical protein VJ508_14855, partial [Saprospiraceae bacterium]|nr:hypothetical protein [Saprospiraceae bacterium]